MAEKMKPRTKVLIGVGVGVVLVGGIAAYLMYTKSKKKSQMASIGSAPVKSKFVSTLAPAPNDLYAIQRDKLIMLKVGDLVTFAGIENDGSRFTIAEDVDINDLINTTKVYRAGSYILTIATNDKGLMNVNLTRENEVRVANVKFQL